MREETPRRGMELRSITTKTKEPVFLIQNAGTQAALLAEWGVLPQQSADQVLPTSLLWLNESVLFGETGLFF